MAIGLWMALIIVGAILAWVVSGTVVGIAATTLGLVLVVLGAAGLLFQAFARGGPHRGTTRGTPHASP